MVSKVMTDTFAAVSPPRLPNLTTRPVGVISRPKLFPFPPLTGSDKI